MMMIIDSLTRIYSKPIFFKVPDFIDDIKFYIKLEGLNIANSIKIKAAKYMIEKLERSKKICVGKNKIIESSSGNLGVALSIVCKEKGYPFICVIDPHISPINENLMRIYDCKLIKVKVEDESGGYLGTRIRLINKMLSEDPTLVWTNQYGNIDNCHAHFSTTAQEISSEFKHIDYLFIGAGTTGTLMGCLEYFNRYHPDTRVIAVDSVGSVTFGGVGSKRYLPGLGTSQSPSISKLKKLEEIIYVREENAIKMCRYLLKKRGLFVGGSTGSVVHAVKKYANRIKKNAIVIAISPDFGTNYLMTIYNDAWVKRRFGNIL